MPKTKRRAARKQVQALATWIWQTAQRFPGTSARQLCQLTDAEQTRMRGVARALLDNPPPCLTRKDLWRIHEDRKRDNGGHY